MNSLMHSIKQQEPISEIYDINKMVMAHWCKEIWIKIYIITMVSTKGLETC